MRRKKLFLVVLILLGVGAGMFFVGGTPGAPLVIRLTGVTNKSDGSMIVSLLVSNRAHRAFRYYLDLQALSNGAWAEVPVWNWEPYVPHSGLAVGETEQFVMTCRQAGAIRFSGDYLLDGRLWERWIDELRYKLNPTGDYKPNWRYFETPTFELPSR
jgi:hypothetical protein